MNVVRLLVILISLATGAFAVDGNQVVTKLGEHPQECQKPNDGNWVALPEGLKCGSIHCEYPQEWCGIRELEGLPDLFCVPLSQQCQNILSPEEKTSKSTRRPTRTTSTSVASETTTSAGTTIASPTTAIEPTKSSTLSTVKSSKRQPRPPKRKSSEKFELKEAPIQSTRSTTTTTTTTTPSTTRTTTTTQQPTTAKSSGGACEDFSDICCFWAGNNQCNTNPTFMKRVCRRSCGVCDCAASNVEACQTNLNLEGCRWLPSGAAQPAGPFQPAPPAGDGRQTILIPTGPRAVPPSVSQSSIIIRPLGAAGPPGNDVIRPGSSGQNTVIVICQNRHPACPTLAAAGLCARNRTVMAINCPLSCGLCTRK